MTIHITGLKLEQLLLSETRWELISNGFPLPYLHPTMKKNILSFLLFSIISSNLYAQGVTISAKVMDAETHETLPSASIYIDAENSTIANIDGEFSIEASSTDMLTVSYVGYQSAHIKVENVGTVIELSPYAVELSEVKVLPLKKILEKLRSNIEEELSLHKRQESNFFYRQTTTNDGECCEYIEAFFNGYSEIALRSVSLITGRYGALRNTEEKKYSRLGNYYDTSCISPYARKKQEKNILIPLMPDYEKLYDVDYDILKDKTSEGSIYRITFTPRPNVKKAIVKGTIYVDASSYKILKYEGDIVNQRVIYDNKNKDGNSLQISFSVTYTHHRDFTEVQSVSVKGSYSDKYIGTAVTLRSTMFNVGKKYFKGKKKLESQDNLRQKISSVDYEPYFWKNNVIVKRTPMEERVVEMFDKENIFSNIKE